MHMISALLLAAAALNSAPVRAAETSAAAASALKVLSMPLSETRGDWAQTPAPTGASVATGPQESAPSASNGLSITVQKGESIDAVLRRGLPRLPLRDDFMRQALAKANPKIFPRGQTYPVKPGTVLMLPSQEALRQMITVQYPDMVQLLQKSAAEATPPEGPTGPDKRRWVRFP